jgi:sulfite reductase beta subunit-like hemoprotein
VIDRLFATYTAMRHPEESFLNFTRRHNIAELKAFCTPQED